MTTKNVDFDRRTVLKALGGAATVGVTGIALTGSGAAQATLDTNITGTKVSNDRGAVDYVGVTVDKTLTWDGFDVPVHYLRFKHEVTLDNSTIDGNTDWHTLYDKRSARLPDWSNYGDDESVVAYETDEDGKPDGTKGEVTAGIAWQIIHDGQHHDGFGYGAGDGSSRPQDAPAWAEQYMTVPSDGVSKDRIVKFRSTVDFYTEDVDGNPVQVSSDDGIPRVVGSDGFIVTVTNEGGTTSGSTEDGTSTAG